MKTEILKLPCTNIQVFVNDNPIQFEYENASYNKYYDENDKEVTVLGAINIILNPKMYQTDDVIFIRSSAGNLASDGGDEGTVNCVAKLEDYTYGLGGPDTEFIEWNYDSIPGNIPDAKKFGYNQRVLDYELIEMLENGLKFKIVKSSKNVKYANDKLIITVVWENNVNDYAYDIVSFLTC